MSGVIIPKENDVKVYIDDRKLQTLVSFEVQDEKEFYPLREVLCRETEYVRIGEKYILKLVLSGEEEFPREFFVRISTPFCSRTYTDCRVTLVKDKAASGEGFCKEYTVMARGCNSRKL